MKIITAVHALVDAGVDFVIIGGWSLPSLIKAKRAAGREKDLRALPELEGLLGAQEPD
jgi:predicted nucleotidyltransferase